MKKVSLRELHEQTGVVVREAAAGYSVVITDRGRPIATITPYAPTAERRSFAERRLSKAFMRVQQRHVTSDATAAISADRDRG